jgi:CRP-like cAMP-binding protein
MDTNEFNSRLINTLAEYQKVHVFERGVSLFKENEAPVGVHVLLSGEVDLLFARRGDDVPLHFASAGQILGLSSLVSGRNHEYTATATTTVLTNFIERDVLFNVLHDNPQRWFDVLQVLSSDIISCYDRVKQLATGKG